MRNISFSMTKQQVLARSKFVTRRIGWEFLDIDELMGAIEKGQGLKKGEKIVRLGTIRVADVRRERLDKMTRFPIYGRNECLLEGFPNLTPEQFVEMFCRANSCKPDKTITRIRFEYV